jgi:alpha-beta hydrolase superfamily lysophospholipase
VTRSAPFPTSRALLFALLGAAALAGCAPRLQEIGPEIAEPMLTDDAIVMADGARLPLRRWLPAGEPVASVLALHGFNDYSRAFELPATEWATLGIATYAYDQRGFGATEQVGIWPGEDRLIADLMTASALVRAQHPDVPLFLLGESMGGAVVMAALDGAALPDVDGAVLVAPAVWGREMQGAFASGTLWFFAHTMPWLTVSGESLNIVPTDNVALLREMSRDPLVLKESRIDTIYGLVGLMDRSLAATERLGPVPTLILYGAKEDVLPPAAVMRALERLPIGQEAKLRVAIYPEGYHMLLRDLGAATVRQDVANWLTQPAGALPSGADETAQRLLRGEDPELADVAAESGVTATSDAPSIDPVPTLAGRRG